MSLLLVWMVLRDPAVDYRLVAAGSLLPDIVDAPFGGAGAAHTVAGCAVALAAVMLATRHRRRARRRFLAVPIAMVLHLLLDGVWADAGTFWWPAFGWPIDRGLPAFDRPLGLVLALEGAGALALAWCWRRFGLADPQVRGTLVRTGHLPRGL